MKFPIRSAAGLLLTAAVQAASAQTPTEYLKSLEDAARNAAPGFAGFSAARGQAFFDARHGTDWSCSTCHTANPLAVGRHAKTGRPIEPLAPAADARRFTDAGKSEKWFKRNCNDVLGRACTAPEKGDVVAYLVSLKR
ncbi:MAG: DUF1924 domain-containing protein [Gemmatimonadota bacterium]